MSTLPHNSRLIPASTHVTMSRRSSWRNDERVHLRVCLAHILTHIRLFRDSRLLIRLYQHTASLGLFVTPKAVFLNDTFVHSLGLRRPSQIQHLESTNVLSKVQEPQIAIYILALGLVVRVVLCKENCVRLKRNLTCTVVVKNKLARR